MKTYLALNVGSSSLKFSLFDESETLLYKGAAEEIGSAKPLFRSQLQRKEEVTEKKLPNCGAALEEILHFVQKAPFPSPSAIGHRLVHGGDEGKKPLFIDAALLQTLRSLTAFAPLHLPFELAIIEKLKKDHQQVACFDTSFHQTMPLLAKRLPLPTSLWEEGIRRYGFHGLSYEYILWSLGEEARDKKIVIAHIGNGVSMSAISNQKPVDTTMGFTPTGGVMMGTRSGDLDPGIISYLLSQKKLSQRQIDTLINNESGLLALSEKTSDMRKILRTKKESPQAKLAFELFCYQLRKALGSMVAALGGVDLLVFTGGIGERSAEVREEILSPLAPLGIEISKEKNAGRSGEISSSKSRVTVKVLPTDEDRMIARHTKRVLDEREKSI